MMTASSEPKIFAPRQQRSFCCLKKLRRHHRASQEWTTFRMGLCNRWCLLKSSAFSNGIDKWTSFGLFWQLLLLLLASVIHQKNSIGDVHNTIEIGAKRRKWMILSGAAWYRFNESPRATNQPKTDYCVVIARKVSRKNVQRSHQSKSLRSLCKAWRENFVNKAFYCRES